MAMLSVNSLPSKGTFSGTLLCPDIDIFRLCCRGLEKMLAQRRKLLQYLRRADFDAYAKMLSALGLKDRYMKQVLLSAPCAFLPMSRLPVVVRLQPVHTAPDSSCRGTCVCPMASKYRLPHDRYLLPMGSRGLQNDCKNCATPMIQLCHISYVLLVPRERFCQGFHDCLQPCRS